MGDAKWSRRPVAFGSERFRAFQKAHNDRSAAGAFCAWRQSGKSPTRPTEILIGLAGDLYLVWRDAQGKRHEERLIREDGKLQAFVIAPQVPHLIKNRSTDAFGTMQVWEGIIDEPTDLTGEESLIS